jgi:hypothetical protein
MGVEGQLIIATEPQVSKDIQSCKLHQGFLYKYANPFRNEKYENIDF